MDSRRMQRPLRGLPPRALVAAPARRGFNVETTLFLTCVCVCVCVSFEDTLVRLV